MKKRKKSNGFIIRLFISASIVVAAVVIKNLPGNFTEKVANAVNGEIDYKEAVSAIGEAVSGEEEEVGS